MKLRSIVKLPLMASKRVEEALMTIAAVHPELSTRAIRASRSKAGAYQIRTVKAVIEDALSKEGFKPEERTLLLEALREMRDFSKSVMLRVVLSPEKMAALQAEAKGADQTLSEYVRTRLFGSPDVD